jgi:lipopolysaccharide transport system permease protein
MRRYLVAPYSLAVTLVRNRFLLGQMAVRSFAARHAGSFLGWLWTPVSTAILFGLYVVVFSAILQIRIDGLGIDLARRPDVGFGVFLMTGLVPFLALNDAVLRASRVFRSHASLVQRVRFPAEVLVLGDVLGALMHHAIAVVIVVGVCAVGGHLALDGLGWLALAVLLFFLWIVGLSLLVSVVGAFVPDLGEVLTLLLQVLFYAAPILYPMSLIQQPALARLILLNPLTSLAGVARSGLLGAAPPPLEAVAAMAVAGVALLWCGAAALERWRATIPDYL